MATASVPNPNFVNGAAADADEVDANFAALVSFLNGSVVHLDGSKAFTAAADMGGFRVTNMAAATAASDAPRFDQVAVGGSEVAGSPVTVLTTATEVDRVTVASLAAGSALVAVTGVLTSSGVTYPTDSIVDIRVSVTGGVAVDGLIWVFASNGFTDTLVGLYVVPLSAGSNDVVVTAIRTNYDTGSGPPSGGTVSFGSGTRVTVIGAS